MLKIKGDLLLGIFITFLSILLWKLTHNILGWSFLFGFGAYYIIQGIVKRHKNY